MISKKTVRKLASVFIVGLLAALFTVNSFAIEYGGTSGEGGQSTASGGGLYSIEENNGVCGYRFTMVNSDGKVVKDTYSADVLCSGYSFYGKASRAWRFYEKYPKTWWIGNVNTKFDWTQNNNYVVVDSDYGLSLPTDTKKNEEMMKDYTNLNIILKIIGFNYDDAHGVDKIPSGSKVLCEPLFLFSAQGHLTTMTITEIGVYGRYFFGENKGTSSSYNKNSWDYIANFTNRNWPRQLYSENTMLGWTAASWLDKRTSFKNLIYYGYGVSFAYDPKTPPAVTPTPDTKVPVKLDTYLRLYTDPGYTQRVAEGAILREGETYYPIYTFVSDAPEELNYYVSCGCIQDWPIADGVYSFKDSFELRGAGVVLDANLPYIENNYSFSDSFLGFYSSFGLYGNPTQSGTGAKYVQKPGSTNTVSVDWQFTILPPTVRPVLTETTGREELAGSVRDGKLYSGQVLRGNTEYTNNSSFAAKFRCGTGYVERYLADISAENGSEWYSADGVYQYWYDGNSYVEPGGTWTNAGIQFRAYNVSSTCDFLALGWATERSYWEAYHNEYTGLAVPYYIHPTDVSANDIVIVDADTGNRVDSVCAGQRVYVQYTFTNRTGVPVLASYHGYHDNKAAKYAAYTFGTNWPLERTVVMPANATITVTTPSFYVDGKNHAVLKAESYIYLYDLIGNTAFEYNRSNNVKKNDAVGQPGVVPITTPYKVTLVTPNSTYRRGTTVVTSFEIQNLSDVLINGPKQKRAKSNAVAMLELYTGPNRTGKRLGEIDGSFTVPAGETTLVWFQWEVPEDAPDVIYGYITADRSMEYIGSQNTSQEVSFAIGSNRNVNTPDTAYAEREAYWWHWEQLPYSLMNQAVEDYEMKEYQKWGYWTIDGDRVVYKIGCAGLSGSTATITPIRNVSSHYDGEWDQWVMRSGYGFDLTVYTGRPDSQGCTEAQTVYSYFPEFIYSNATLNNQDRFGRYADEYFNNNGKRVGFNSIYDVEGNLLHPESGGDYATFVTMKGLGGGHFILPRSDLLDENVHFIPVWYPDGPYQVLCYVRDYWTPGGMISGFIESNTVKIDGCMYDDVRISFSPPDPCDHLHQTTKNTDANKPGRAHYTGDVYCEDCKRKIAHGRVIR